MKAVRLIDLIEEKISGEWGTDPISTNAVYVIRTTNFTNNGSINYSEIVKREIGERHIVSKKLKYGDIIIEKSGGSLTQPVGRVVFFDRPNDGTFLCNNFTTILRPKSTVFPKFLFHILFNKHLLKDTLKYQNKTTGILNLKLDRYLNSEIVTIPTEFEKQIQIAFILDTVEKIRWLRNLSLESLNILQRAIFLEMFYTNNSDYAKWDIVKLGSLAAKKKNSTRTGPFGSKLKHEEFSHRGDVAVLGIDNVVKNRFTWGKKRFITKEKYESLTSYTVYPRDVVISIMATLGRTAVLPDDLPITINTKHLAALTMNEEKVNPYYIAIALQTDPLILSQLKLREKGAIMSGLNLTIIKDLNIKRPPKPQQDLFEKIFKEIERGRNVLESYLSEAENLQKSLLQKAFEGTLEIDEKEWKRLDTEGWIKNYIETGSPTPKPSEIEFIPLPIESIIFSSDNKKTVYSNISNMLIEVKNFATEAFGEKGYFSFEELEKVLTEKTQKQFAYNDLKDYIFKELDRKDGWFEQGFKLDETRDKSKGKDESRVIFQIKEQAPQ
jgi:type I restriction enzyme, S subunit